MRHIVAKWLAGAVVLGVLATSCGSGGAQEFENLANLPASDIDPPAAVDTKRTGLPGLYVETNSPSLRRVAKAPEGEGAVVLFVAPGGPFDGLGLGRGDLITEVGGETIRNHSRALALLHGRPGEEIEVSVRHRDGRERTIQTELKEPLVASLRQYLNPLVGASPRDPVLRYLRAQTPGSLTSRLTDLDEALKVDRRFVEALSSRASLIFDARPNNEQEAPRFISEALRGWNEAIKTDPENSRALTVRSTSLSTIGRAREGRRDAEKVIDLDPTHPRGYYALAIAEEELKRPERGLAPARAAVELDPFNIFHWRALARLFTALKREDDCVKTTRAFAPFLEAQNLDDDADNLRRMCR